MLNMFPMQGMGSNGLGMAGGSGLGNNANAMDPRLMAILGAAMSGGGGGMGGAPQSSPLMPNGSTPMSQFIGARPALAGVAPVVGGGMAGPSMAPPPPMVSGAPPQGGGMDIASILKTPAGLQSLLNALKGNQEGLKPTDGQPPTGGIPPAPPGAPSNLTGPYSQGFGNVISQGLQSQQAPQQDFLQRLLAMFGGGGGGMGGGGAASY